MSDIQKDANLPHISEESEKEAKEKAKEKAKEAETEETTSYPKVEQPAVEWVPIEKVLEALGCAPQQMAASQTTLLERIKKWVWFKNSSCKYINLRIDTRDLHCIIYDGDNKRITLDQLAYQY